MIGAHLHTKHSRAVSLASAPSALAGALVLAAIRMVMLVAEV